MGSRIEFIKPIILGNEPNIKSRLYIPVEDSNGRSIRGSRVYCSKLLPKHFKPGRLVSEKGTYNIAIDLENRTRTAFLRARDFGITVYTSGVEVTDQYLLEGVASQGFVSTCRHG